MSQLVQVTTTDGVRLDGLLQTPPAAAPSAESAVDAWLLLHGTGSNFYSGSLLGSMAARLLCTGAAVLRVNTRGHDFVSAGSAPRGPLWLGAAFERVYDSPQDVTAWIEMLVAGGYGRIGILGHSLGAVKAIYTLAQSPLPNVKLLVAVSPPRLSYSHYVASSRASDFLQTFADAERHAADARGDALMQVKFPLRYLVSADAYMDRYGPAERYNVLKLIRSLACPTLFTYGSQELQADVSFAGMPEAIMAQTSGTGIVQVAVVAGADHLYSGVHDALYGRVERWL